MPSQIFHQIVRVLTRFRMNEHEAQKVAEHLENLIGAKKGVVIDVLENAGMNGAEAEFAAPGIIVILDLAE